MSLYAITRFNDERFVRGFRNPGRAISLEFQRFPLFVMSF
jgi:hypothetical protein